MTMPEATDPMMHATPVERATVAGRYELVGVNGGLLPVALDADDAGTEMPGCSVLAGELRLEGDGTFVLELTARIDLPAGAGGIRSIASGGTWRFLPSALDRTSGEVRLTSVQGQSSAAVAGVSLVLRMGRPEGRPGSQVHWVYIRR
jgi:hypothetical protein